MGDEWVPTGIDAKVPSVARVYDYLLGGKDNFAADRAVGEQIRAALPEVELGVRAQRALLRRVVRHLVAEAGVRQLIDVGSGLPTAGNVHEVAHEIEPQTRVVYVDNDPIVLAHARALLASDARTVVIDRDVRRPEELLADPALTGLIDFSEPIGLLLCGILHFLSDEEDPGGVVARLTAQLPGGSYVFVHHLVKAGTPGEQAAEAALRQGVGRGYLRTPEQVSEYLAGLDLVEPGLVAVPDWRPELRDPGPSDHPVLRLAVAAVARKADPAAAAKRTTS